MPLVNAPRTPFDSAPSPRLDGRRVAVVGAGLAGLRAAWKLHQAGARVTVIEERQAVGGKAALEIRDGFSIDRSLQAISFSDRGLLSWAADLGLGRKLLPLRPVHSAQLHGAQLLPCPARTLGEIARLPGVRLHDRLRLLRLPRLMRRYAPLLDLARPERAAELDYRSVADFARLYLGRSVLERFVAPRVAADTLGDERELSRVAFLLHWKQSEEGGARPGLAGTGLGELAQTACRKLDVRTGLRAQQVKDQALGRLALECSSNGGDEVFEVDALLLATSPCEAARIAASLLTPAERDFFAGVRFGPLVTLSVASDRPLTGMPQLVRVPHVERSPIEVALIEPGVPGGRAPEETGLITLSAGQRAAEAWAGDLGEHVRAELLAASERLHPGLGRSLRFAVLHRDPIGMPRFEVGAYRELARFQHVQRDRRSVGRRLYFAGDYLAGPRFEDAIASGARSAAAVFADLA
jgi:oxygen-dependent protoporphyrinogen oxidase